MENNELRRSCVTNKDYVYTCLGGEVGAISADVFIGKDRASKQGEILLREKTNVTIDDEIAISMPHYVILEDFFNSIAGQANVIETRGVTTSGCLRRKDRGSLNSMHFLDLSSEYTDIAIEKRIKQKKKVFYITLLIITDEGTCGYSIEIPKKVYNVLKKYTELEEGM